MADLAFHTGVKDRFSYVCRALKKAQRLGMSACVLLQYRNDLEKLDNLLWSFEETSFIPHAEAGTPGLRNGAYMLTLHPSDLPESDILFLLTEGAPKNMTDLLQRIPKIIDVVSAEEPGLTEGRNRFRSYKNQGINPSVIKPRS